MKEPFNPPNNIVAATDFSANSDLAVRRAAQIAQQSGKALHLLHVVHPLKIYPELMFAFDPHLKEHERLKKATGMKSLDQLAVKVRNEFGIKVLTSTRIGRTYMQISEFIQEQSADLVVVGFHGETSLLGAMMGSTASRLLNTTPCNILVVRNMPDTPYKRVIAAVDISPESFYIASMASAVSPKASIEVLHAFDIHQGVLSQDIDMTGVVMQEVYDEAMKHVNSELDKLLAKLSDKHMLSTVIEGYSPQVIHSRAIEVNADLVVLGRNSKSAIKEFMLGSVSKAVLDRVNCDVLLT